MVRLKVGSRDTSKFDIAKFQFHNGSIKSGYAANFLRICALVSIPQWFD